MSDDGLRLPTTLPDPEDPVACAEFRLVHGDKVSAIISWNIKATKTIKAYLKARGDTRLATRFGSYGEVHDSYEYPDEIVETVPGYGHYQVTFNVDQPEHLERAHSLLCEEIGDVVRNSWEQKTVVDKAKVREAIKLLPPDSEVKKALVALRQEKTTLGRIG
jgi:hypothetical protein